MSHALPVLPTQNRQWPARKHLEALSVSTQPHDLVCVLQGSGCLLLRRGQLQVQIRYCLCCTAQLRLDRLQLCLQAGNILDTQASCA